MPTPFVLVCDLLDDCYRLCTADKPSTQAVVDWFARNRVHIDAKDADLAALLSTLLPEKRTDRVYCIKTTTLEKLIGKALMLGSSRLVELGLYRQPGQGTDLADCVERILINTPNPTPNESHRITIEEIDEVLHGLASRIKWSSPSIRRSQTSSLSRGRCDLEEVYRRLSAREAKWFTRLILKNYQPLILDSQLVYRCCDSTLPLILKVQEDFSTAIKTLQTAKSSMLADHATATTKRARILATVQPKLGVKVGRQNWFKGRSIKHCLDMGGGRMSVENKIDGEYCQIHVSISDGKPRVQIFSKSGKDSTEDRHKLHGAIVRSLGLGRSSCNVRKGCILEGELVVYDDAGKILPFHKIRNHVARRGRLLDVDMDSPPRSCEHLMIVYYDILLLDEQSLLGLRHSERFKTLENTIHCERGQAELVRRTLVDFHRPTGASELRKAFASVITAKGEGLVLKPDDPYFNLEHSAGRISGLCIKLKKEYIGAFGDVGDFAVIGAGFNAMKAKSYRIPNLRWTVFYVGCLDNKEAVKRWNAKPEFTVVSAVEIAESHLKTFIAYANPLSVPLDKNDMTKLNIPKGIEADAPLSVAFQNPPVFDLRCFSFDKPGNMGFWTLRFPAVSKIHFDRDFSDSVTFHELQQMAQEARATPDLEDSQENLQWIAKLEGADPRGRAVDAVSQMTATTMSTPSPLRSRTPFSPVLLRSRSPEMARSGPVSQSARAVSTTRLIKPPTSSLPVSAAANTSERGHNKRKLSAQTSPIVSSTPKRQAIDTIRLSSVSANTKPRMPLGDVDGNASITSLTPDSSFAINTGQEEHIYEFELTTTSFVQETQENQEDIIEHSVQHSTESRCTQITISSSLLVDTTQSVNDTKQASNQCKMAGNKCHLFGSIVLLASAALTHSLERTALLGVHGVTNAAIDMDDWLEANNFGATLGNKSPNVVILVDTVDKANETKHVLAYVEQARKELPRKTRGWIAVYDWRMLEHLKVLEDEQKKRKYYDGFHDPWRRWYCGIV